MSTKNHSRLVLRILDIITGYPEGCTRKQIAQGLNRKYARLLANDIIVVNNLVLEGAIIAEEYAENNFRRVYIYRKAK